VQLSCNSVKIPRRRNPRAIQIIGADHVLERLDGTERPFYLGSAGLELEAAIGRAPAIGQIRFHNSGSCRAEVTLARYRVLDV
jgi:hypothetical protein